MSLTKSKHILTIDDDELVLEIIKSALEIIESWTVSTATSGRAGMIQAMTRLPDLILSDVNMPDMDGFDTLHLFHADVRTRHIPFIFLTSETPSVVREKAIQLGVKAVIPKPFEPLTLSSQIMEVTGWTI